MECVLLTVAACKLGAVCMPVNWRLAPSEIEYIVNNAEPQFMMADAEFVSVLQGIKLPSVRQTACTERAFDPVPAFEAWYGGFPGTFSAPEFGPDDAAPRLYSSGTTGLPKGVVLSHRGLLATCQVVSRDWKMGGPSTVSANALPTFHVAGMTMLLVTLYAGAQTVVFPEFVPAEFLASVRLKRVTHAFVVPACSSSCFRRRALSRATTPASN